MVEFGGHSIQRAKRKAYHLYRMSKGVLKGMEDVTPMKSVNVSEELREKGET